MNWIRDIATWWTTGLLGMALYWLPLAFCLVGYTMKCWSDYRHDLAKRAERFYSPTITVGTIIGRAFLSVTPVANIFAGVFDVAPKVFGDFLSWIGRVFDKPLVKPRVPSEGSER